MPNNGVCGQEDIHQRAEARAHAGCSPPMGCGASTAAAGGGRGAPEGRAEATQHATQPKALTKARGVWAAGEDSAAWKEERVAATQAEVVAEALAAPGDVAPREEQQEVADAELPERAQRLGGDRPGHGAAARLRLANAEAKAKAQADAAAETVIEAEYRAAESSQLLEKAGRALALAEVGVQKAEIDSELGAERLESLRNEEAELLDKLEALAAGLESRMGMLTWEHEMAAVRKADLAEVTAFARLPTAVALPAAAVLIALGEDPEDVLDDEDAPRDLTRIKRELKALWFRATTEHEMGNVPAANLERLRALLQGELGGRGMFAKGGVLSAAMVSFVRANVVIADARGEAAQLKEELARVAAECLKFKQAEAHLAANKKKACLKFKRTEAHFAEVGERAAASVRDAMTAGGTLRKDATLDKLVRSKDWQNSATDPPARQEFLERLRTDWLRWAAEPEACTTQPGSGRAGGCGKTYVHPLIGEERPLIEKVLPPDEGWMEDLLAVVRMSWSRRNATMLDTPLFGAPDAAKATIAGHQLSSDLQTYIEGARELLTAWPRGDGAGEFMHEPIFDDGSGKTHTPAELRGVTAEWWSAVVDRAAFCPTRAFVVALCRPLTVKYRRALWYWVPPKHRAVPDVFMSHAWDSSLYDIRPPEDASAPWVDCLAVGQHSLPAKAAADGAGGGGAEGELREGDEVEAAHGSLGDVPRIKNALEDIGRTCMIVPASLRNSELGPFARSWCIFEAVMTPPGCLSLHIGWNTWDVAHHRQIAAAIDEVSATCAPHAPPSRSGPAPVAYVCQRARAPR